MLLKSVKLVFCILRDILEYMVQNRGRSLLSETLLEKPLFCQGRGSENFNNCCCSYKIRSCMCSAKLNLARQKLGSRHLLQLCWRCIFRLFSTLLAAMEFL